MTCMADIIVQVKVRAGAKTESVEEIGQHTLKVRVTTAPEKGKANKRVAELVAQHYHVPVSCVILTSGSTSPEKRFLISGVQ